MVNFARRIFGDRLIWTLFIKLEFIFEHGTKTFSPTNAITSVKFDGEVRGRYGNPGFTSAPAYPRFATDEREGAR